MTQEWLDNISLFILELQIEKAGVLPLLVSFIHDIRENLVNLKKGILLKYYVL